MTIGERIRKLRREHDLTQEKLANYLAVTTQAVSKWECNLSSPDLSLIGPLTKLFHVSADELLGLDAETTDARRAEIDAAYDHTFRTGDLEERYRILEKAVAEYPGDMKYLENFAWAISNRSISFEDEETRAAEQERAVSLFRTVAEDCEDEKIRNSAIHGLCQNLYFLGRRDEARKAAELYTGGADHLRQYYLTGEELETFREGELENCLMGLIERLHPYREEAADAAEAILRAMLPDGNYIWYHYYLYRIKHSQAKRAAERGAYDEAVLLLGEMASHAAAYDECHWNHPGVYRFSPPFFKHLEADTRKVAHTGDEALMHGIADDLADPVFDPLRDRADFRALIE